MKKVLITGAGAVGSCLAVPFRSICADLLLVNRTPTAPHLCVCPLDESGAFRELVRSERPQAVIHAAGNKNVFQLEQDPEAAERDNFDVTASVCDALAERGVHLIYVSSDYVFDGVNAPFDERSRPGATTVYGRSKQRAEQYIIENSPRYTIVRSAGLFGHRQDFVHAVLRALRRGNAFRAFTNLRNSPTYSGDLFEMLRRTVEWEVTGILHACGSEQVSRYEYARMIAEAFRYDPDLIVPHEICDVRPNDLRLDAQHTYATLEYTPPCIRDILRSNRSEWTVTATSPHDNDPRSLAVSVARTGSSGRSS